MRLTPIAPYGSTPA